ncbi:hypothetical protein FRC17_004786 [Serendipita sp. 399]|nr:hypothetical protein FRC17_004786 [Serendipita sp. 399]
MADSAVATYLTKQIKVTFRLLSRALSIHVNDAKAALESFYQNDRKSGKGGSLHATYIVTGEDASHNVESESMDVDGEQDPQDAPSPLAESIVSLKVLVVPEECLENCKPSFRTVRAVHIYSLEPSTFRDPSLLVTTVDAVRKIDATRSQEELGKLGIPISKACKYNTNIKGKPKVPQTSSQPTPAKVQAVKEEKVKKSETKDVNTEIKTTATAKPVMKTEPAKKAAPAGLDWSKAKSKTTTRPQEKVAESSKAVKSEPKKNLAAREPSVSSSASEVKSQKRGIKRALLDSDEEEEETKPAKAKARLSAPAASESTARTKKGVLLSDDEDDAPPAKVARRKTKSDHAMMEWSDDEDVALAPRHTPGPPSTKFDTAEEDEDEEAEQSSLGEEVMETSEREEEPTYAKVKRATKKKGWPVGANGLRKRRVVKTREFEDDRGFMQFEDYSEYESVNSESEQPPEPVTTKKASQKASSSSKPSRNQEDTSKVTKPDPAKDGDATAKPKPKPKAPSKSSGKSTITSFFQKK